MNAPFKSPGQFTDDEFERLIGGGAFKGLRVELRRGWITKMNAQYVPHLRIKRLLSRAIERGIEVSGMPVVVDQEGSVKFGCGFNPMPDIIIWNEVKNPHSFRGMIPGDRVALCVEVADESLDDDLGDKRAEYAQAGLAEYWVADVQGRMVHLHADPQAGVYRRTDSHPFGATFSALTLPGVTIDTAALTS